MAFGWTVQSAQDVHHRRFSAAALADDGDKFTGFNLQINPMQNLKLIGLAYIVAFDDALHGDDRQMRRTHPLPPRPPGAPPFPPGPPPEGISPEGIAPPMSN